MKTNLKIYSIPILMLLFIANVPLESKTRNIMLVFDLKEYKNEIKDTIDYFFEEELTPNDQVIIITPSKKLFSFSKETLKSSKEQIAQQINAALRKHTSVGASDYQTIYRQMEDTVNLIENDQNMGYSSRLNSYLIDYAANRQQLYNIRMINESMLLELSDIFKNSRGNPDNQIFLFVEKVLRPIPSKETMEILRTNREISFRAVEVFLEDKYKTKIDLEKISKEFKNAGIKLNLIYINPKVQKHPKFQIVENSGDLYDAISKIVEETEGRKITTALPRAIFE